MENKKVDGDYLLNANQLLILKAAILPEEQAIQYWQQWFKATGSDKLDLNSPNYLDLFYDEIQDGSETMLALVHKNLAETNDPTIAKLVGIGRFTWAKNQMLIYTLKQIIVAFDAAGIDHIILKGIPVALKYYKDASVRVAGDGDILVPIKDKGRALKILTQPPLNFKTSLKEALITDYIHAAHTASANGTDIDLHWNIFNEYAGNYEIDKVFWQKKEPFNLQEIKTSVLSPTHQLFNSLIHARAYAFPAPIRWVTDSFYICKNEIIDWNELIDLAVNFKFVVFLQDMLPILKKEFQLPIPDECLQKLKSLEVSYNEARYHQFNTQKQFLNTKLRILQKILTYPFLQYYLYKNYRQSYIKENALVYLLKMFAPKVKSLLKK